MSKTSEEIQEALRAIDAEIERAKKAYIADEPREIVDALMAGTKIVQWARGRSAKLREGSLLTEGIASLINDKERDIKEAFLRSISEN